MQLAYIFFCKTCCFAAFDDVFCFSVDAYNAFQLLNRRNGGFALQVCKVLF